jgi:BirA family biotin operon repressor/biotin-[acetyl-CoA-carboxylase] ligase
MKKTKNINYIHFDTIDSTNTWAKTNAHVLDPRDITCITAQEQTAGRGRWLRKWISPKGQNIYATLYFCLPNDSKSIANLGQVLSLSCVKILKGKGFEPLIKWPNDLILEGKKVAGILCERIQLEDQIGIALGIGINVNMTPEMLNTVDQPATSLAQLSGHTWALEQILDPLLHQFLEDLTTLEAQGFKPFQESYQKFLIHNNAEVSFFDGAKKLEGVCKGIDAKGRLSLLQSSGKKILLSAGEIKAK